LSQKSILITGCSSGIGRALVKELSEKFEVHATVRTEDDADSLRQEFSVVTHILDLTNSESIQALAGEIEEIDVLINNAGVAFPSPVLLADMELLRTSMEVNYFAVVQLTSLLLPKLIKSRGMVINMSSVSGRVSLPFFHPYASSKYALEAFSDALRNEVWQFGVRVVIVEPGRIQTPIWGKGAELDYSRYSGTAYQRNMRGVKKVALKGGGLEAERIAVLVEQIIGRKNPRPMYLIAENPWFFRVLFNLPTRLRDWLLRKNYGLQSAPKSLPEERG